MAKYPSIYGDTGRSGYDVVMTTVSNDAQTPSAVDVPMVIDFGASIVAVDDSVRYDDVSKNLVIDQTGWYAIKVRLRWDRQGAPQTVRIFNWVQVSVDGGVTWNLIGNAIDTAIENANEVHIFLDLSMRLLPAGTRLRALGARSSTGYDAGILSASSPSAALAAEGVTPSPAAQLVVYRNK